MHFAVIPPLLSHRVGRRPGVLCTSDAAPALVRRPLACIRHSLFLAVLVLTSVDSAQIGASRFALATVNDGRGRPVIDVSADDFVVQEAGEPRDILSVRVADYPIVVVVDNGAGGRPDFLWVQKAVSRLLERLGPRPIAIVTVAGPPQVVASFDDDRSVVLERLAEIRAEGAEESRPLAGAALAARTIRGTGALFSAIVVVTSSPVEGLNSAVPELSAPVIDSGAVMHVVAKRGTSGGDLLRSLAEQTHGLFTPIYSAGSYPPAVDRLTDRLTTELMVEYLVPVGSKSRDVKIGVRLPGARVHGLGVAPQ
jgi:hypothetical protein